MKKITLAFAIFSLAMQAQTFPSPYCDIEDTTIEEITEVDFAGIEILNSDASLILLDRTDEIAIVLIGETYVIEVAGNTAGDFDNDIVAFIDWNNNEVLDDEGEVYQLGTLNNSTGNDGVFVSSEITVPSDAMLGSTRIRITKIYQDSDSPAVIDPCAISFDPFGQGVNPGFGQALDFTVAVSILSVDEFDAGALKIFPSPVNDILKVEYKSEITALKIYNLLGQEVYVHNKTGYQLNVDFSGLQAGPYIVNVISQESSHSFKVIKE